jgi:acetaldehyde dehydrogenase/alcohol dehydrogenase
MSEVAEHAAEENELFDKALVAADEFRTFTSEQISKIMKVVAEGCAAKAEFYSEWAIRTTGYGDLADKIQKKQISSMGQLEWNPADYTDPQIDHEKKIISFPRPAGVLVGLMPCTNPVATVYYLGLQAILTRNVIILCPHPAVTDSCVHAAEMMCELASSQGAPDNVIQILRKPSIPAVNGMMQNRNANLILAIGGPGMVHAAYSSGTPAIGVGAANVPTYAHASANPAVVGPSVVASSSFDNSLPCTTDSVVLVDEAIADAVRASINASGGYIVSGEDEQKVRDVCWKDGAMNPAVLGKHATWIAEQAGITVPEGTKALVIEITEIGPQELVSKEKMWPVLGLKVVNGVDEAIKDGLAMLDMMGKGHSACVFSEDSEVIAKYSQAMPVCRISVNAPNAMGSPGFLTNLPPTAMLGTGFYGRSSSGDNVNPSHLIQWTRAAYNLDPACEMKSDIDAAVAAVKDNKY